MHTFPYAFILARGHDTQLLRDCYAELPFVVYVFIRLDLLPPLARYLNTTRLNLHCFLSSLSQANSV